VTETLGEGKYLRLVREGRWEYVQRVNATGIVLVVAVDDGKLILVEQYRPAVGARVIDLPAGLAGDEGEEALETAAARELEEETGYRAERFERLCEFVPSPGLSAEVVTLFRAVGLERVGPGGGDSSEAIVVHQVPLGEVDAWVARMTAEGALIDAKLYAGLHFARP